MQKKLNVKGAIQRELAPLGQGEMLKADPKDVLLVDVVTSYIAMNALTRVLEKKLKALKPHLHAQVETHGDPNEKGGAVLRVGADRLTRECRTSSEPDYDKLKALLGTHGVNLLEAFDEVKTVQLNPSKLKYLIDIGKLKGEEVEALRERSWALKAEAGPELKELLQIALGESSEEEEEKPRFGPRGRNRK